MQNLHLKGTSESEWRFISETILHGACAVTRVLLSLNEVVQQ